jgi:uncharacterized protein YggE
MKTLLLTFALAFLTPALFAEPPLPALISTTGSAVVHVVPDLADLSFEVEIRNADLTLARRQQADRMQKVLATLRAAGIAEAAIQSSQVIITPNYGDPREEGDKIRFYRVAQTISCTLHEVKKVPDVTANVILAGATGVREISLRTSGLRVYRDQARAMALHAAREKAAAMATELGSKIGRPYAINEGADVAAGAAGSNIFSNVQQVAIDAEPTDANVPNFAPGTISVTASVGVSFLLE